MHQHLEEGLVSDALSRCEFSGLGYIGFGQSQCNLDAGDLVQLTDKPRAPRLTSFHVQTFATFPNEPPE
jgi:hypothetical protein